MKPSRPSMKPKRMLKKMPRKQLEHRRKRRKKSMQLTRSKLKPRKNMTRKSLNFTRKLKKKVSSKMLLHLKEFLVKR